MAPPDILNCPTDYSILLPPGTSPQVQIIMWWIEPTAMDPSQPISITQTHRPLDLFGVGVTTVTYTFTDSVGNVATCSFNVSITGMNYNCT